MSQLLAMLIKMPFIVMLIMMCVIMMADCDG